MLLKVVSSQYNAGIQRSLYFAHSVCKFNFNGHCDLPISSNKMFATVSVTDGNGFECALNEV